jgi:hypothetical protein
MLIICLYELLLFLNFIKQLTNANTYNTIEVSANNSTSNFYVFSPRPRRIV